jgi:hypothetical protein
MTTSKPKERQFHVVPVPAIFTRGRWECRDYKETNPTDSQILDFTTEKQHNNSVSAANLIGPSVESSAVNLPNLIPSSVQLGGGGVGTPGSVNFIIGGGGGTSTGNVSESSAAHPACDFPSPSTPSAPPIHSVSMPNAAAMVASSSSTTDGSSGVGNVVAIDNKIEQAMDLVKTHLTFAVREEVEILRSTIADLEAKVANLDGENQILRAYAPPEVIANLPFLIQNAHQHKNSVQQSQQFHQAQQLFTHSTGDAHGEQQKLSTADQPHTLPQQ